MEIKACWFFEVSSTILTIYPIIFSLIVNLPAIMTYVVANMFFFGVITFVTVCTEVDATQERSHAGNHIVVVKVDLLLGCGSMINDSVSDILPGIVETFLHLRFRIDVGVLPPWCVIPTPT